MRGFRSRLLAAAAVTFGLCGASGAQAANIVLNDIGGVTPGSQAAIGFAKAAQFWGTVLSNNVTINLNVGYSSLGPGILGSTNSPRVGVYTSDVQFLLGANGNSALDAQAVANLPTLSGANDALTVITNGYQNPVLKQGVDTSTTLVDADQSVNNYALAITRANAKALGFTGLTGADATIRFSSDFAFDFDASDGISANSYDFLGVAIHEIGHALGFVSGVDTYDVVGTPNGPSAAANATTNFNDFAINSVLDMFRYSGDGALDWSVGGTRYFSLDQGATVFGLGGRQGYFSTGQYNGDGRQASHWKDNTYAGGADCSNPTVSPIGILDPTSGRCEGLAVTAMDLAAMDAMGWNLAFDIFEHENYHASTSSIYQGHYGVPEPATWAMMIMGFGAIGATVRRRRAAPARA
jgi:hypothetical protein